MGATISAILAAVESAAASAAGAVGIGGAGAGAGAAGAGGLGGLGAGLTTLGNTGAMAGAAPTLAGAIPTLQAALGGAAPATLGAAPAPAAAVAGGASGGMLPTISSALDTAGSWMQHPVTNAAKAVMKSPSNPTPDLGEGKMLAEAFDSLGMTSNPGQMGASKPQSHPSQVGNLASAPAQMQPSQFQIGPDGVIHYTGGMNG